MRLVKTKEKEQQIISLYKQGISGVNIAKQFGFCADIVYDILKENGVRARITSTGRFKLAANKREQVKNMYVQGHNLTNIAKETKLGLSSIVCILSSYGIYKPQNKKQNVLDFSERQKVCTLYEKGYTIRELAKQFNTSYEQIRNMLISNEVVLRKSLYGGIRRSYKNIKFRSTFEIKFAKLLDTYGIQWLYEPIRFKLEGRRYYKPDFYLSEYNLFVEIKGYQTESFTNKLKDIKVLYPNIPLIVVKDNEFDRLIDCSSKLNFMEALWQELKLQTSSKRSLSLRDESKNKVNSGKPETDNAVGNPDPSRRNTEGAETKILKFE